MLNREYLMLATMHKDITKIPKGMLWSIKYDGMRAHWIPTTRGLRVSDVPYCHDTNPDRVCTGLFSRYGKVIHAPSTFLDTLPDVPLDGELYLQRNSFQSLVSICRAQSDRDWSSVKYMVFDSPRYADLFTDGRINNNIVKEKIICYESNRHLVGNDFCNRLRPFSEQYRALSDSSGLWNDTVRLVEQHAYTTREALDALESEVALGGEGLIGRDKSCWWVPKRTKSVIKLKPDNDDEATIIEHTPGEGKYVGMLGAYWVEWKGKKFKLSGMTDEQRSNPLSVGTEITFRYRTLSSDGIPREARFIREKLEI
jgi:DNA ligase-1